MTGVSYDAAVAEKKGKPGRPRRAGKLAKERFEIRLTTEEHQRWMAAAEAQGISLADLVRECVEMSIRQR